MDKLLFVLAIPVAIYTVIGTPFNVDEIKSKAVSELNKKGFNVIRYEGYQYGSWAQNGGKVWYYVQSKENKNLRYKVFITQWFGELQYYYGDPEKLSRIELDLSRK